MLRCHYVGHSSGETVERRIFNKEKDLSKVIQDHLDLFIKSYELPDIERILIDKPIHPKRGKIGPIRNLADIGLILRPDILIFHKDKSSTVIELKNKPTISEQFMGVSQLLAYKEFIHFYHNCSEIRTFLISTHIHEMTQMHVARYKLPIILCEVLRSGLTEKKAILRDG